MLFNPFVKEFIGHLNGQYLLLEFYSPDRLKPGFERLGVNAFTYDFQTFCPQGLEFFLIHSQNLKHYINYKTQILICVGFRDNMAGILLTSHFEMVQTGSFLIRHSPYFKSIMGRWTKMIIYILRKKGKIIFFLKKIIFVID